MNTTRNIIIFLICWSVIATAAATYLFFQREGGSPPLEIVENFPDLMIKKIDRISSQQWRVTVSNIGKACIKSPVHLSVVPQYKNPGSARTEKIEKLCPNNQIVRIFSFPPIDKGTALISISAHVNPQPSEVEEKNLENNMLEFH